MGDQLTSPLDPEIEELYRAYKFCKLFHCSIAEYEERPFHESQWLLAIDSTYQEAVNDMQERANRKSQPSRR